MDTQSARKFMTDLHDSIIKSDVGWIQQNIGLLKTALISNHNINEMYERDVRCAADYRDGMVARYISLLAVKHLLHLKPLFLAACSAQFFEVRGYSADRSTYYLYHTNHHRARKIQ